MAAHAAALQSNEMGRDSRGRTFTLEGKEYLAEAKGHAGVGGRYGPLKSAAGSSVAVSTLRVYTVRLPFR